MQNRLSKKTTSQKWDPSRRVQTETCDADDHFDIQSLMKKYKKMDYLQQTKKPVTTIRKSNGHSIDRQKLSKPSQSNTQIQTQTQSKIMSNVLTRNVNYNKSVLTNMQSSNNNLQQQQPSQNPQSNSQLPISQYMQSSHLQQQLNNNNHNLPASSNQQQNSQLHHQQQQSSLSTQQQIQQPLVETAKKSNHENLASSHLNTNIRLKTEPSTSSSANTLDPSKFTYLTEKVIGSGTFGVVYRAKVKETGQIVAIKKVLQDKRYKNRELQILKELSHPNVLKMIHAYFSQGENPDEQYLHVVMPYVPETIYSLNRHYQKQRQCLPNILVKLYAYQIMRSLLYIHTSNICHRDIKPHNILVDPQSNRVVLCDFGSAKKLVVGEPNISYICSRCYRAPELIFGATNYTNQIDVWSTGCVIAEMINGEPLFIGESAVDQLVEIIKVLGTPTKEQVLQMNNQYDLKDYKFPQIKSRDWKKVLRPKTEPLAIEFISTILVYSPVERLNPIQALAHTYFDELRDEKKLKQLSAKIRVPNLFDFSEQELSMGYEYKNQIIPEWYNPKMY